MTRLQREMAELNLVEIRKHGMLRQAQFTFPIDGS
jgi:hypothetical protein